MLYNITDITIKNISAIFQQTFPEIALIWNVSTRKREKLKLLAELSAIQYTVQCVWVNAYRFQAERVTRHAMKRDTPMGQQRLYCTTGSFLSKILLHLVQRWRTEVLSNEFLTIAFKQYKEAQVCQTEFWLRRELIATSTFNNVYTSKWVMELAWVISAFADLKWR